MRKLILSLIVLLAVVSACKKENSDSASIEQTVSVSSLPLKATNYIADNYPSETISNVLKVSNSTASYVVLLNTLEELAFNDNGDFIGDGREFHHHEGDSLGHPEGDSLGHHGGHGGHGGHGEPGNSVSVDSLPVAVTDYIASNFSGYVVMHAEIDTLCQFGGVYEVMLEETGNIHLKLYFDLTGNYLAQAERARYSEAPQMVTDFITANYAGYSSRVKMELVTLADGSIQYSIFLHMEGSRKNVVVSDNGSLVCER